MKLVVDRRKKVFISRLAVFAAILAAGVVSFAVTGRAAAGTDQFAPCDQPVTAPQISVFDGHPIFQGPIEECVNMNVTRGREEGGGGPCYFHVIDSVEAVEVRREGGALKILARGTAATAGWRYATLIEQSRSESEIAYDFMACAPDGPAAQVLSPISAEMTVDDESQKLRRITVAAVLNRRTAEIGENGGGKAPKRD